VGFDQVKGILDQGYGGLGAGQRQTSQSAGPRRGLSNGTPRQTFSRHLATESISFNRKSSAKTEPPRTWWSTSGQASTVLRLRMPKGGPFIPDDQIQIIEDWITQGCPD